MIRLILCRNRCKCFTSVGTSCHSALHYFTLVELLVVIAIISILKEIK
ncbi:MAG: type II secretion system protein [Planctomycetota bacterium]